MFETEKLTIRPGFVLLAAAVWLLDRENVLAGCAAAMLVHELGHLAAIRLCGGRMTHLTLSLEGGLIRHTALSARGEAITALSGPAANLAASVLCAMLPACFAGRGLLVFTGAGLLLAAFNLLPIRPLDGAGFWEAVGMTDAVRRLELPVSLLLLIFGLYIWIKTRYNSTVLFAGLSLSIRVLLRTYTKERMIQWKT